MSELHHSQQWEHRIHRTTLSHSSASPSEYIHPKKERNTGMKMATAAVALIAVAVVVILGIGASAWR